jgi:hypothetical protein
MKLRLERRSSSMLQRAAMRPFFEDQDFIAGLIDVAEQMRGDEQPDAAFFANFLDQLNHALAGDGIEAVGGLIEDEKPSDRAPAPGPA